MIATCTKCNHEFTGDRAGLEIHETVFGHKPEQHYTVIADLSAVGNPPVTLEIPDPVAELIRSGALTLAIVPDSDAPRGIGLREIILNPPVEPAADDWDASWDADNRADEAANTDNHAGEERKFGLQANARANAENPLGRG